MSLQPGRVARAGDLALVISEIPEANNLIVKVTSDPYKAEAVDIESGECVTELVNLVERFKIKQGYVKAVKTAKLIPISPDEDTRKLFEAEKLQDKIDEVLAADQENMRKLIERHIRHGNL